MPKLPNNISRSIAFEGYGYGSRYVARRGFGPIVILVAVQGNYENNLGVILPRKVILIVRFKEKKFIHTFLLKKSFAMVSAFFIGSKIVDSVKVVGEFLGKVLRVVSVKAEKFD